MLVDGPLLAQLLIVADILHTCVCCHARVNYKSVVGGCC